MAAQRAAICVASIEKFYSMLSVLNTNLLQYSTKQVNTDKN